MNQMTEIEPEIETVTVTVKEFKQNLEHYLKVKKTKRLLVFHEGERVATLGPWLPGEERIGSPKFFWFLDELFPPGPVDMESRATRSLLEDRGIDPSYL